MIKLIYKEKGVSSFQKIKKFAKENKIKKIGHTGTLDPMASGLLLIATDEDTKLINYLDKEYKTYITKLKFHFSSDTLDIEGKIEQKKVNKKIILQEIINIIPKFIGKIEQMPPIFSAKKINGKKAYELARQNKEVKLKSSIVEIKNIKILNFDFEKQELELETEVSRGTYIRSLIRDIANALGTEAIMIELERIKLNSLSIADLTKEVINPLELLDKNIPKFILTEKELKKLWNGLEIDVKNDKIEEIMLIFNDKIVGFGKIVEQKMKSIKLFGNVIEKELKEKNGEI
ncbi:tRNA pseudouridine(55) synthase TruB [Mesomycoplasma molare]|uniref:tRNA pseudouridine synthase B n=1 Tax=Mesomycoplasma molare TaxID=171288 RepID=A0ABY5TTU3_9BACT|nr:tRNA pseudouridine(55) synthase TruB [Mesomycoplasma molare]UWD34087.1 tRNA pseudouridine(55) synthase TruB [Mesomycoplasma molare]